MERWVVRKAASSPLSPCGQGQEGHLGKGPLAPPLPREKERPGIDVSAYL